MELADYDIIPNPGFLPPLSLSRPYCRLCSCRRGFNRRVI